MTVESAAGEFNHRRWTALAAITSAHAIALRDGGLIDDDALATLLDAIERVRGSMPVEEPLPSLAANFDERIDAQLPAGMAGVSGVGRGGPEVIATVTRLLVRDDLIGVLARLYEVRRTLIAFANQHVVTLLPVYLDGQVAQPSTLAHLVAAVLGALARASARLEAALVETNRSPMGSGVLASSGLVLDRERFATLLGCDGLIVNTLDAVSATDYLSAIADALAATAVPIRRLATEFMQWHRTEPASFRLPETLSGFVTGLPHARIPLALEGLARAARGVEKGAAGARGLADERTLSPWFGGIDEILSEFLSLFARAQTLFGNAIEVVISLEVNRAWLAHRAGKGFSTSGDLADFLMIEERIEPGAARNIAALTISRAREQGLESSGITPELIDGAALLVIGREIKVEFEAISRYLAPRRFIERRTATGAPAPSATRALLEAEAAELAHAGSRLANMQATFQAAAKERERIMVDLRTVIGGS